MGEGALAEASTPEAHTRGRRNENSNFHRAFFVFGASVSGNKISLYELGGRMSEKVAFHMSGNLTFLKVDSIPEHMIADWQKEILKKGKISEVIDTTHDFLEKIKGYELHDALGITALYSFMKVVIKDGHTSSYPEHADLEVLQALLLSYEDVSSKEKLSRDEVGEFWLELMRQNYAASQHNKRKGQSPIEALADSHIAYYRNPYGDDFFDRMLIDVTSEYDSRYLRTGHFASAGELLIFIRKTIWGRFQSFYNLWVEMFGYSRKRLISEISLYAKLVGGEEVTDGWKSVSNESLRNHLRNLVEDNAVKNMFKLDSEWIESSNFDCDFVISILDKLSLSKLERVEGFDGLCRFNPIAASPFVKSVDGYSIYCLLTLMSLPFSSLLTILGENPDAKTKLEKVRGWFAERETGRILREAFPSAKHVSSGYWFRNKEDRIESDLIVLVSRHLLIFEAKGALINDRMRSGAAGAAQQFLKKTWGKSTQQGAALSDHLKFSKQTVNIVDGKGVLQLALNPDEIRTVSRFSVSLEQVGPLMNSPRFLRELNIIEEGMQPAPCIILSELANLLNVLKDELHRLHYLTRRFAVCSRNQIFGDEMDVFSIYLQTGFSGLIASEDILMILGESYRLSDFKRQDGKLEMPADSALRNSCFFDSILSLMRTNKASALLEVGLLILDIPYEEQLAFEREVKKRFRGKPSESNSPVLFSTIRGLLGDFTVCGIYMDREVAYEGRKQLALNTLASIGGECQAAEAFVFAKLNKSSAPYDALYYAGNLFSHGAK